MIRHMIRCSDERNRTYSIITTIASENGVKFVLKEPVFPEGKSHIASLPHYAEVINKAYAPDKACPVRLKGDAAVFDFIHGETQEAKYRKAVAAGDRRAFEAELMRHRRHILGNEDNLVSFSRTEDFEEWFGDAAPYEGQAACAVSDFDLIAGNLFYTEEGCVIIDYEWTMEFPVPADLLLYHCVRDLYYHMEHLEEFYPLSQAMEYLGIATPLAVMQESYEHFFRHVVMEPDGRCFGSVKTACLKGAMDAAAYAEAALESQRLWEQASQAVHMYEDRVRRQDEIVAEHDRQAQIVYDTLQDQFNHFKIDSDKAYADLMLEYQKLNQDRDVWKARCEAIENSRAWRLLQKVKKG